MGDVMTILEELRKKKQNLLNQQQAAKPPTATRPEMKLDSPAASSTTKPEINTTEDYLKFRGIEPKGKASPATTAPTPAQQLAETKMESPATENKIQPVINTTEDYYKWRGIEPPKPGTEEAAAPSPAAEAAKPETTATPVAEQPQTLGDIAAAASAKARDAQIGAVKASAEAQIDQANAADALNKISGQVAMEAKKDPRVGDALLQFAEKTGRSILEAIQGFAVGYSGRGTLISEIKRQEKQFNDQLEAQKAEAQAQRDFQAAQLLSEQEFQKNLTKIEQSYKDRMFAATTQAEKESAEADRAFQHQENQAALNADRANLQMELNAKVNGATAGSKQDQLQDALGKIIAGLKGN